MEDLAFAVSREKGVSESRGYEAVRKFFDVITVGLEREKYVRVNGLGVFKQLEVEGRRAVNVNTKEEMEIAPFKKVTYVPDEVLKGLVNKPFLHFEKVELKASEEVAGESISGEESSQKEEDCEEEEKAREDESVPLAEKADSVPPVQKKGEIRELEQLMGRKCNKGRSFWEPGIVLVILLVVAVLLFVLFPEISECLWGH